MTPPARRPSNYLPLPLKGLFLLFALFAVHCDIGSKPDTSSPRDLSITDATPCDGCANLVDLAGTDGALLPLYAICMTNDQCQGMICHLFAGTGDTICTKMCAVDADCPMPSPGCNKIGLCRIH